MKAFKIASTGNLRLYSGLKFHVPKIRQPTSIRSVGIPGGAFITLALRTHFLTLYELVMRTRKVYYAREWPSAARVPNGIKWPTVLLRGACPRGH